MIATETTTVHGLDPFEPLEAIVEPAKSAVLLSRPVALEPVLAPWLAQHPAHAAVAWGWDGDPDELAAALPLLLAPLPVTAREIIGSDLSRLVPRFGRLVRRRHLRVRFEALAGDGCRKFHVDYMALRMLVTYAGPGTEVVLDPHVDRSWLGQTSVDIETCNARIVPDPSQIRRTAAGDVVLLKGEHYRGGAGRAAVHRSPPIEGTGARRLVMKIDVDNCGC